ncbi:MAG: hypothetical protein GXC94_02180 [Comamonadaceae bacterium]|jgi:hypothetical protein|nr:hypothetical protein [Comamonadaceae bacterium]
MFNRDQLQAQRHLGYYPTVPAMWPNRATRRAIQQGRESRLSGEWRERLVTTPHLRAVIRIM